MKKSCCLNDNVAGQNIVSVMPQLTWSNDYVQRRWEWVIRHFSLVGELDFLYCIVLRMPREIEIFYSKTRSLLERFVFEITEYNFRVLWVVRYEDWNDENYKVSRLKFYIIFAPLNIYSDYDDESIYALIWENQFKEVWRKILGKYYRRVNSWQREFKFIFPFRPIEFFDELSIEPIQSVEEYIGSHLSYENEIKLRKFWNLQFGFNDPVSFGMDVDLQKLLTNDNEMMYPVGIDSALDKKI